MPLPRRRHPDGSTPTARAAPARQVVITPPRPAFVADATTGEISGEEGLEEMMEEAELEEGDDDADAGLFFLADNIPSSIFHLPSFFRLSKHTCHHHD